MENPAVSFTTRFQASELQSMCCIVFVMYTTSRYTARAVKLCSHSRSIQGLGLNVCSCTKMLCEFFCGAQSVVSSSWLVVSCFVRPLEAAVLRSILPSLFSLATHNSLASHYESFPKPNRWNSRPFSFRKYHGLREPRSLVPS
jgi:hypothetical protein